MSIENTQPGLTGGTVPSFNEETDTDSHNDSSFHPSNTEAEESQQQEADEPTSEAKPKRQSKPKRPAGASVQVRKRIARQVLDDASRLRGADSEIRSLAANLLGCSDDPEDMAVQLAAGNPSGTKVVSTLTDVKGLSNGIERVSKLGELSDKEFAEAWSLMHELGLVGRKRPNNQIKAVTDLAEAVDSIDERLGDAVDLIDG